MGSQCFAFSCITMWQQKFWQFFLLIISISVVNAEIENEREGEVFSLFNVVQFKNSPCVSSSTLASGSTSNRNGTCFTSSECSDKGGSARGSCASGFGVCCVFTVSATSTTINNNDTYIQNPGFPTAYGETNSLSYTIQKCSEDICWLRLDFEQFTTQGPADTVETNGGACVDTFTVTSNSGQTVPPICGIMTGQHIYVDLGALPSDSATLNFAFSGTSTTRLWDIKVAQIPCGANYAPPDGCLQYQEGLTGRLETFNFASTTSSHLLSQSYAVCIRREAGYCCVQYQVCADDNSFNIDSTVTGGDFGKAKVDIECTLDYITIETSTVGCVPAGGGATFTSRYCNGKLNASKESTQNAPICDCTFPFEVNIHTDAMAEAMSAATNNRGVCLEYTQIPC